MNEPDLNRAKWMHEAYRQIHNRRLDIWTSEPRWNKLKPKFQRIWNEFYDLIDTIESRHKPRRGSDVAAWLKEWRDHSMFSTDDQSRSVIDSLLDDYRLHADTVTPLDQVVVDGGDQL